MRFVTMESVWIKPVLMSLVKMTWFVEVGYVLFQAASITLIVKTTILAPKRYALPLENVSIRNWRPGLCVVILQPMNAPRRIHVTSQVIVSPTTWPWELLVKIMGVCVI